MTPPRTRWGVVALLMLAGVFGSFQLGKLPAAIPSMRVELGLTLVAAAWILSLLNLMGAVAGVGVGALADWLGHRRAVVGGLLLAGVSGAAGGFATGETGILVSRFFEGLGVVFVFIAVPTLLIRAVEPRHLRLAFGIWGGYMPVGMAIMVVVTPYLIGPFGWRGLWFVNAALLTGFAFVLLRAMHDLGPPAGTSRSAARLKRLGRDIGATFGAGGPLLLGLIFTMHAANFIAVFAFLPTILIEDLKVSPVSAAALTAFAIVLNAGGNLVAGILLQRGAPRWLLLVIANVTTGLCSIGIYADAVPPEGRYLLCVVLSFVSGILPASAFAAVQIHAPRPDLVATTTGLISQGANIGNLLGPPAAAMVAAWAGGWHATPWLIGAMAAIGVVLSMMLGALERRRVLA
ncbi:MAG: MFS transporter [Alphaproteobacteria bacterium]|nr:MFS transporter [Alphaproteobacteria bacterium]